MTMMLVTFGAFLTLMTAMAVGVIFSNKPIKGSCGGLSTLGLKDGCALSVVVKTKAKALWARCRTICSMTLQLRQANNDLLAGGTFIRH